MAKSVDKNKRYDRATNELLVLEFINKYIKEKGGYPGLEIIKKGISQYMSARTIDPWTLHRIFSDINILDTCNNHPSNLRLGEFLNGICNHGIKGNIHAGKLWLSLVFGWNEKKMFEVLTNLKASDKYDYPSLSNEELHTLEPFSQKLRGKPITQLHPCSLQRVGKID